MSAGPWIVCEGCIAIVDLTGDPEQSRAQVSDDGSWWCYCPACKTFNSGDRLPAAPEIRARLEAITAPILARLAVEPVDPNQLSLPLGATS